MRRILLPIAVIALCGNGSRLSDELEALKGQTAKTAIDRLGFPTSEGTIAGHKTYTWQRSASGTVLMPTTAGMLSRDENYDCMIRLVFGDDDRVVDYNFSGDTVGCKPYMKRLKDSRPRFKPTP